MCHMCMWWCDVGKKKIDTCRKILSVIKRNVSLRERWWHVVEEAKNWLALHFWKVSTFWSAGNRFLGDTAQHLRHTAMCFVPVFVFLFSFLFHHNCICLSYSLVSYGCCKLKFNLSLNSTCYTIYTFIVAEIMWYVKDK